MEDPIKARTLVARGPGDLTQLVPRFLGFNPSEALVIMLTQDREVQVTSYVDIAQLRAPGAVESVLDRALRGYPGAVAYLIAYTAEQDFGRTLLDRCCDHRPGQYPRQTMLVSGNSWYLPDGQSGPVEHVGSLAMTAANQGLKLLAERSEIEAEYTAARDSYRLRSSFRAALRSLPRSSDHSAVVAATSHLLNRNLDNDRPARRQRKLDPVDAIQLTMLLNHPMAYDLAVLSITEQNATAAAQLWRQVVNATPPGYTELPLYLAGLAAWASGDGVRAGVAYELALRSTGKPAHTRAAPLTHVLDDVVPPTEWEAIRLTVFSTADPLVKQATTNPPPAIQHKWEQFERRTPDRPDADPGTPPTPGIPI